MSAGYFSYALLAALATALLVAAFTDLRRREIDNWLNAAIAFAAPLWWLAMGFSWMDIAFQIGLALLTFALAVALFVMRQMGGGDVKLLTALALWFSPLSFVQLVVLMAVIGGGASVGMAVFNMQRVKGESLRDLLAVLAAIGWVGGASAVALAIMTGRPIVRPGAASAIGALAQNAWVLAGCALVVVLILGLGFIHIVRRQRSRLPIPYGIAIAVAGLWVLAAHTIQTIEITG